MMDFSRTVEVASPIDEVWALVGDVAAVAGCIPGVKDLEMTGADSFTCRLAQHVGSVKADFALTTRLEVDEGKRTAVASSEGNDRGLSSTVNATQRFALSAVPGGRTRVDITADVRITGRIATFGHRIIGAKAQQVTVEAVRNVDRLLEARRSGQAS